MHNVPWLHYWQDYAVQYVLAWFLVQALSSSCEPLQMLLPVEISFLLETHKLQNMLDSDFFPLNVHQFAKD